MKTLLPPTPAIASAIAGEAAVATDDDMLRESLANMRHGGVATRQLLERIEDAARSSSHVLIEGPCGSGKEFCARAIQTLASGSGRPFVALQCAGFFDRDVEAWLRGSADPDDVRKDGWLG